MNPAWPIEELELGVSVYIMAKRLGVTTIGDFARVTIFELKDVIERARENGAVFNAAAVVRDFAAWQRWIEEERTDG